jgi:hypothetical protein
MSSVLQCARPRGHATPVGQSSHASACGFGFSGRLGAGPGPRSRESLSAPAISLHSGEGVGKGARHAHRRATLESVACRRGCGRMAVCCAVRLRTQHEHAATNIDRCPSPPQMRWRTQLACTAVTALPAPRWLQRRSHRANSAETACSCSDRAPSTQRRQFLGMRPSAMARHRWGVCTRSR